MNPTRNRDTKTGQLNTDSFLERVGFKSWLSATSIPQSAFDLMSESASFAGLNLGLGRKSMVLVSQVTQLWFSKCNIGLMYMSFSILVKSLRRDAGAAGPGPVRGRAGPKTVTIPTEPETRTRVQVRIR
jgi:hypothetical protein